MARQIDPLTLFVSTQWLADHLDDPEVRVFDASWHMPAANRNARAEFLAGHVPGAAFFDIDGVADRSSTLPHMLPAPEVFAAEMRRLGFGDGMHAVVYDSVGLFSAPRLWWTLHVFGVEKVSILAGGLPAWTAEGRPLQSGETAHEPKDFTPKVDAALVADAAQVNAALLSGSAQVVDARSAERFMGLVPEPRPGLRAGHMPGAYNLPFASVIESGRLKDKAGLDAAFAAAGLNPDKATIASCGSGMTACILSLAFAASGRAPATVYDGSWSEWGGRADLPVVSYTT
ncbi:3-mercaptopyruvate sulfurtransferase [Methylocystis echinoides]|uniref:Sulfurtransferase n=1 Tax=Methylocystis echinoides TaxID=29468 RepID=A0A9W6GTH0_9HYPH|nr:3-mercaptopyruvate sulfurtransferase [Methylocystis echinoides]GLI92535.1 sulfurtransferase [Methylocystis echinoides]